MANHQSYSSVKKQQQQKKKTPAAPILHKETNVHEESHQQKFNLNKDGRKPKALNQRTQLVW